MDYPLIAASAMSPLDNSSHCSSQHWATLSSLLSLFPTYSECLWKLPASPLDFARIRGLSLCTPKAEIVQDLMSLGTSLHSRNHELMDKHQLHRCLPGAMDSTCISHKSLPRRPPGMAVACSPVLPLLATFYLLFCSPNSFLCFWDHLLVNSVHSYSIRRPGVAILAHNSSTQESKEGRWTV